MTEVFEWVSQLIILSAAQNVSLSTVQSQLLHYLYNKGDSPEKALAAIKEVLRRVAAINANPA